ncbi:MAG: hypothetical protein EXQ96_03790, partial [Alphaproteobacteria bacterium]|nr:hypothetical protein [Alphaproteobacteria bacterium]
MPWSGQGGGGGGPWGGGGRGPLGGGGGPQPPDFEELLRKGQERIRTLMPRGFGGPTGIALLIGAILVFWLFTGFYRVQPDEQGVELVFGKWYDTTQPGLNYNWPSPIGSVLKPQVTRVNRVEVGFR